MKELIAKHFTALQTLHELSIAFYFGPRAPYLPALGSYIQETFGKESVAKLTERELEEYLTNHYIDEKFSSEVKTYTEINEKERKDYVLNKIGRESILSLVKDLGQASASLEILEGLDEAVIEFRPKVLEMSPLRRGREGNAIGDFFQNLSAGLGLGYATLNLFGARETIISYHLLRECGATDEYSDPLMAKIVNEDQLEEIRQRIKEWDKASLVRYSPASAEIVHHFWRNGYLRYKSDRLDELHFYEGVLVDRLYQAVVGPDETEFVL